MQNEKTYFFIFIAEQHPSLFKISKGSTISRHIRIKVKSEKSKCIVAISLFRQTFSLFIFNCSSLLALSALIYRLPEGLNFGNRGSLPTD